jgi:hypothetical protein
MRPPDPASVPALSGEGPTRSLGRVLDREIALRAAVTTFGATGGWLAARVLDMGPGGLWRTGNARRVRADTVGLVALVQTQLAQTLLIGWRSPLVVAGALGSAALLAAVVQTPGLSRFFGCTPLGPVGWAIAGGATAAATAAAVLGGAPWVTTRLERLLPRKAAAA